MSILISLKTTEGPRFIERMFLEQVDDGSINIGMLKDSGQAYAFTNVSKVDLLKYVSILTGATISEP